MKSVRRACLSTFACALLGYASPRVADATEETPDAATRLPSVIVAVDFEAIPKGELPHMPREVDAPPAGVAKDRASGIKLLKMKKPVGKTRLLARRLAKMGKTELVELAPDHPEIAAIYVPSVEGTDFQGESVPRMACRRKEPPSPVRWETLTVGSLGDAKLEVKDLWFDAESCTVGSGSTSQVALKAIAWEGTRPWLFAVRDEKIITFVMPRTDDVSADAMVGTPLTVRGGFTRVSVPVGRWGSSSVVAHLSSLELKAPPWPPKSNGKGPAIEVSGESSTNDQPIEIALELVQTMSEKAPTLLVRRSQPEGD